jgi:soluble lytic murein transglycosylase-like protein
MDSSALKIVQAVAQEMGQDVGLALAIARVESSGNPLAARYEPHYRWTLTPEKFAKAIMITEETELMFQKTSLGVMQVMGALARELGFRGHLTGLCYPEIGARYGVMQLEKLWLRYNNIEDVIAAYNAGSPRKSNGVYVNQNYVDKVMADYRKLLELK